MFSAALGLSPYPLTGMQVRRKRRLHRARGEQDAARPAAQAQSQRAWRRCLRCGGSGGQAAHAGRAGAIYHEDQHSISVRSQPLSSQGGRLDQSARVQEVEEIMNKAAKLPGPGQYALLADLIGPAACARPHALAGVRVQRPPSAVITSRGITTLDAAIKASAVSPGPCRFCDVQCMHTQKSLHMQTKTIDCRCAHGLEQLLQLTRAPADTTG
jgi:hypothetical protein